jgi:hypothetical protein
MIHANLSKDCTEGTKAWLERRKPEFTGS